MEGNSGLVVQDERYSTNAPPGAKAVSVKESMQKVLEDIRLQHLKEQHGSVEGILPSLRPPPSAKTASRFLKAT
jgi:hypothetical protein